MGIQNMRILVVDDYDTMIKIIKNLLQQIGCRDIQTAKSGEQALEIVNAGTVDFIVSDWNMEPMSGLELLKAVRSHTNRLGLFNSSSIK